MTPDTTESLLERVRELEARLEESEEALLAIRNGEVDAFVAQGPQGDHVYTLQGADEAYRLMVEEMGEGAITVSADGLILFSNDRFAEMLRHPLERVMGSRLQDFVVPGQADQVSSLLGGQGNRTAEVLLNAAGGSIIPAYLSIKNVVLSEMECRCVIITDLSAQKRHAETAAILDAVPLGVFIAHDAACASVTGNRRAHELLRVQQGNDDSVSPFDSATLKSWRAMRDGIEIPSAELPMQMAGATGRAVQDCEFEVLFDDGAQRSWLGNAQPLFDDAGVPRGSVGAFIDITERRRSEEALEAANLELQNFGNALTKDLREPLELVVRFARMMAQEYHGRLGDDADQYISDSLEGALRIERLLDALLEYWEVAGKGGASVEMVDCNQVLSRALAELQPLISKSRTIVTSGTLPTVVGDQRMLDRVFRTLIGNAIQYKGAGTPAIHVSALNAADRWLFSVRDNGIGIDPKYAERIFGMFSRLHGNEAAGTGIGLTLCRKIVERHGGRIWVESAAGMGAAFRFTIPNSLDPALAGFPTLWPHH